jgi:transposase
MAKRKRRMPTLWEVPDELWERIEQPLEKEDPPEHTGRKRLNPRRVLDGIIFRLRKGCQWNQIPHVYGDDSTIHRCYQHWREIGHFEKIWASLVEECDEPKDVNWELQAADAALGKALLGGRNRPEPHGPWQKRDETQPLERQRPSRAAGRGGRRSQGPRYQTAGADPRGDRSERPQLTRRRRQHLSLDKS